MNKQKLNISILGIGTELTSGQILNRNAQWISQKMHTLGADSRLHMVVPDDRHLILEALQNGAQHADILFVTGGLGPTSDDFTRDLIAQWTGLEMIWDEASWQHLNERLKPRNIPVKEMQKQQCYFPQGSQILINRMGTANAFYLNHQGKDIYVLPGPPREIEAVWQDWIQSKMEERCQHIEKSLTRSWDTLGLGESQIADLVEEVLEGCPFERGYRVHMPYVEFKLSYSSSQASEAHIWLLKVDQALKDVTFVKDGDDICLMLFEKLKLFKQVRVHDQMDGSFLLKRLFPEMKNILSECEISLSNASVGVIDPQSLTLSLAKKEAHTAVARVAYLGVEKELEIATPYTSTVMLERAHQYFTEKALMFFYQELEKARKLI